MQTLDEVFCSFLSFWIGSDFPNLIIDRGLLKEINIFISHIFKFTLNKIGVDRSIR